MKIHFISAVFFACVFAGCNTKTPSEKEKQPEPKKPAAQTDLEKMHQKGKIRSIQIRSFGTMPNGQVVMATPGDNAEMVSDADCLYNRDGNLEIEQKYIGSNVFSAVLYKYDRAKKLIERELITEDQKMHGKTNYIYNDKGDLVELKGVFEDSTAKTYRTTTRTLYKDFKNGLAYASESYRNDTLINKSRYSYNAQGKIERVVSEDLLSGVKTVVKNRYDAYGNLTVSTYEQGGRQNSTNECTYDEKGNAQKVKVAYSGKEWTYAYTFDEHGNWISQKQSSEGQTSYVIKRTIGYYE